MNEPSPIVTFAASRNRLTWDAAAVCTVLAASS